MSTADQRRRVVPIIPARVLERHHAQEPGDGRFKAAARLMQSLWRKQQGYPCGHLEDRQGKARRLGSRLTVGPAQAGANFISPEVAALTQREVAYREIAAVMDTKRLYGNLLSSQALTFNLFGPLKLNPELATANFRRLFPEFVAAVEDIWFEHSPGRAHSTFTGDHTAFDALVCCRTVRGGRGFIAFEVKYTEGATSAALPPRPRYDELSRLSGVYRDPSAAALRSPSLQQFWREHLLAYSMLQAKLCDEGLFVVTVPSQNHECGRAIERYGQELTDPASDAPGFARMSIETIIDAIGSEGAATTAKALRDRYFDFAHVDRALFQVVSGVKRELPRLKAAALKAAA
jgi:hypothetical protein